MQKLFNFVYNYNVAHVLQTSIFQVRNCVKIVLYLGKYDSISGCSVE